MNWKEELRQSIKIYFEGLGIQYTPNPNVVNCLIDFMNLEMKLIKSIPRTIFKSDKIKAVALPEKDAKALNYIERKIKDGKDLTSHQSKKTLDPTYNDLLLNDWVIQHIHISDERDPKARRFYKRSNYLLFAAFSANQAFFIDIQKHGKNEDFAQKEFLEIMCRNWPTVMEYYLVKDVEDLSHNPTDLQIHQARQKGLSFGMTKVDGKVYMNPGTLITTSGTNIHAVRRGQDVYRRFAMVMEEIEKNPAGIIADLSRDTGREITDLKLSIKKIDEYPFFALYENNSELYLAYNPK